MASLEDAYAHGWEIVSPAEVAYLGARATEGRNYRMDRNIEREEYGELVRRTAPPRRPDTALRVAPAPRRVPRVVSPTRDLRVRDLEDAKYLLDALGLALLFTGHVSATPAVVTVAIVLLLLGLLAGYAVARLHRGR